MGEAGGRPQAARTEGILSGPSTGASLVAALQTARRLGLDHRAVTLQVGSPDPHQQGGDDHVIVRAWHATATVEGADAYHRHFTRSVLPALRRIGGYQGAYLLRRDHDSHVELQVLSLWDSLEAIRRFAGATLDRAVVDPDAQAVLADYDTSVAHHTAMVVDTVHPEARTGQ